VVQVLKHVWPLLLLAAGCVTVKPYERQHLAHRAMEEPYANDGATLEYRDKVVRTKTATSLPGATPGGGCGCTQ
jgi:hypothetical protein